MLPTTVSSNQLISMKNEILSDYAIPWNDLPTNTVYQIDSMKKIGDAVLLNLRYTVHDDINVWATEPLVKVLEKIRMPCFVNPLGTTWHLLAFEKIDLCEICK